MIDIAVILILLHGPDGREINVNPDGITSIYCKMPGIENKLFTHGAHSVIAMADGKTVAVRETCTQVQDAIQRRDR